MRTAKCVTDPYRTALKRPTRVLVSPVAVPTAGSRDTTDPGSEHGWTPSRFRTACFISRYPAWWKTRGHVLRSSILKGRSEKRPLLRMMCCQKSKKSPAEMNEYFSPTEQFTSTRTFITAQPTKCYSGGPRRRKQALDVVVWLVKIMFFSKEVQLLK